MLKTALLFPGQGSQRPGMLAALPGHTETARTLEEASDRLGRDWRDLDRAASLERTDGAQLALLLAGVASARALFAEGAAFDAVLGHSVGAFAAAVAAGALDFGDALDLVALRGRLMAELHPSGYGMTAIVGLREQAVAALVDAAREAGPLHLSNRNAELQITVSGASAALDRIAALALDAGARKAERLDVATPSHCPLVAEVADRLAERLAGAPLNDPAPAYVSARRARRLRTGAAIGEDLARNVAEPVLWRDAMRLLAEHGLAVAIEAAPGATLRDLAAEAAPQARCAALSEISLASAIRLLASAPS